LYCDLLNQYVGFRVFGCCHITQSIRGSDRKRKLKLLSARERIQGLSRIPDSSGYADAQRA
jgi:hypothetical protein